MHLHVRIRSVLRLYFLYWWILKNLALNHFVFKLCSHYLRLDYFLSLCSKLIKITNAFWVIRMFDFLMGLPKASDCISVFALHLRHAHLNSHFLPSQCKFQISLSIWQKKTPKFLVCYHFINLFHFISQIFIYNKVYQSKLVSHSYSISISPC